MKIQNVPITNKNVFLGGVPTKRLTNRSFNMAYKVFGIVVQENLVSCIQHMSD